MSPRFEVRRDDLTTHRVVDSPDPDLADGQVRLRVERFALTANNITYGVAGDIIGYWNFFPADEGWGQIPVWGIAEVADSRHENLATGERFYGYFPMAEFLVVQPEKVNARGFADGAAHRAELPVVYNQYTKVAPDTGFEQGLDNHAMLYRPLFTTSFVLDDFLADNDFFGADTVVLGSASSKTAFGLAFLLHQRADITVVGLTSSANKAFVESMGIYDQVLTYDHATDLDANAATVYVDMAGNRQVLSALHHHLNDQMKYSCGVGITHWDARDGENPADLPGARPAMFFAPSQIVKRNEELGPAVYQQKIAEATAEFFTAADRWVTIEEHGFGALPEVYDEVLNGIAPSRGIIVTNG